MRGEVLRVQSGEVVQILGGEAVGAAQAVEGEGVHTRAGLGELTCPARNTGAARRVRVREEADAPAGEVWQRIGRDAQGRTQHRDSGGVLLSVFGVDEMMSGEKIGAALVNDNYSFPVTTIRICRWLRVKQGLSRWLGGD